ncbi:magnesium transporter CorA family protein [Campylobacter sp. 2014D-0216]|uniref:magnesium transporter CorA family protein n=1 Tax=Campylobacter sp. 2014D-0216 TaxID=1813595 RepID=UPI0018A3801E|nr:magnesium transporter CorA family protein [Campylobacter sp. 2014D-0216]QOR01743.1 magnesium transporter CorA family protein [Campylobacter sp. 2014D-0216]
MLSSTLEQITNNINISNAYYELDEFDIFMLDIAKISRNIFVFKDNQIFEYKNKTLNDFSSAEFVAILKEIIRIEKEKNNSIGLSIEKREELILEDKKVKNFLTKYFTLKVKLAKSYKTVSSLLEACKICHTKQQFIKKNLKAIILNLSNLERNIKDNITRLESIYTYINTIRSEKINQNIYFLSIMSAIFLPLNLIVGFFGMNTKNLFLSESENGTYYVLAMILAIFFILFLWYQMKDKKELDLDEFSIKKKKK